MSVCLNRKFGLYLSVITISVVLSIWMIHIDGVINNDGVHYILTAEYIAEGMWADALQTFKWPAYSFLIYLAQLLPFTDFEIAAHIVTTVGFTFSAVLFLLVVDALGADWRTICLAALVVLSFPGINEFRAFLIRDSIFLAFYLGAIWFLISYTRNKSLAPLCWSALMIGLAALFRVEALVLMCIYPLLVIGRLNSSVWRIVLALVYIVIGVKFLSMFYGWWMYRPEGHLDPWALIHQPTELMQRTWSQLSDSLSIRFLELQQDRAGWLASSGAGLTIMSQIITIVVSESIRTLTIPIALILLWALFKPSLLDDIPTSARRKLTVLIIVQMIILLVFAASKFFLASRYPLSLCITLLVLVPFILNALINKLSPYWGRFRRHSLFGFLGLLLVVNSVEGLDRFSSKHFITEAGSWFQQGTPARGRLITNSTQFSYYSGRYGELGILLPDADEFAEFIREGQWRYKDYIVAQLSHKNHSLANLLQSSLDQEPIREFFNKKGDRVVIYYTADD
ncbi:MAG: hypothetical protein ACI8P9_001938 [Parasphingorhabdus sp.]|jgi:hypothetical protein